MALRGYALTTPLMEQTIICVLSIIFTLFLSHGFTPDSLILDRMIPIPKDKKKSFCNSSNYRAIALSSILNTIRDWIILLKEHTSLTSSPLQFGFKKVFKQRNA